MLTNGNKEVNNVIDMMAESKAMMEQLMGTKVMVKPTLLDGHFTVNFKGIAFIETRHKGHACMAVEISYADDKNNYSEVLPLDGNATPEAKAAALGQVQRYMLQIAEQLDLVGIDINFDVLNQHIGKAMDIKVYQKEFTSVKGTTCHARAFGFWKKPQDVMSEVAVTTTEIPKF
jgi:hypothetical protein